MYCSLLAKPFPSPSQVPFSVHGLLTRIRCTLSSCFRHVRLFATPQTVVHKAPLSVGFFRPEYWSGSPSPPPGIFPTQGMNSRLPASPALQADSSLSEHMGSQLTSIRSLTLKQRSLRAILIVMAPHVNSSSSFNQEQSSKNCSGSSEKERLRMSGTPSCSRYFPLTQLKGLFQLLFRSENKIIEKCCPHLPTNTHYQMNFPFLTQSCSRQHCHHNPAAPSLLDLSLREDSISYPTNGRISNVSFQSMYEEQKCQMLLVSRRFKSLHEVTSFIFFFIHESSKELPENKQDMH